LAALQKPNDPLVKSIKLDTPCGKLLVRPIRLLESCIDGPVVLFFKTREPLEPVSFVHRICSDALQKVKKRQSQFVRRLTPVTLVGKATETGLAEVARKVLAPHFHGEDAPPRKVGFIVYRIAPAAAGLLLRG
jgi:hypothetical protein